MQPPAPSTSIMPPPQPSPFAKGPAIGLEHFQPAIDPAGIYYTQAQIAGVDRYAPTVILYPHNPARWRDIIGRAAAPLADEALRIGRSIKGLLWPQAAPAVTMAGSAQATLPQTRPSKMALGCAAALAATSSALVMGCGSETHPLVDATFKAVGGLGLFFVGMNFLSDGMQALSGSTMKRVISTLTTNRFAAFAVGLGLTSVIQSSSITTTLTVGAVDSGMMQLSQALGVVLGSHVGTTATGWLLATKVAQYGLPLIGAAAIPYVFSRDETRKTAGMAALGLGMVFLGLATMSSGLGSREIKEPLTQFLSTLHDTSYWGILKSIVCGLGVTLGIQSSSATLGIAMSLAGKGILPYEAAAAVMLGANMGTPITAALAAMRPGVKTDARRVALAHELFHAIGALLCIYPISPFFMKASRGLSESMFGNDPKTHVAMFHTLNNLATALFFLATLKPWERLVQKVYQGNPDEDAVTTARSLSELLLDNPSMALEAVGTKIADVHSKTREMFDALKAMMAGAAGRALETGILKGEQYSDDMKLMVHAYAERLVKHPLSTANARLLLQKHLRIIDQLESIGDHIKNLYYLSTNKLPAALDPAVRQVIVGVHDDVFHFFAMVESVAKSKEGANWEDVIAEYRRIKNLIVQHKEHVGMSMPIEQRIPFHDALDLYRHIISNLKNIVDACRGTKR